MDDRAKIRFTFENSDGGTEVESMWAIRRDDGYEVDNIPCYVLNVARGDIVSAETDEGGLLRHTGLVRASGHSTVHIFFDNEGEIEPTLNRLTSMGCAFERSDNPRLIGIDVPPTTSYPDIKSYLDEREHAGVLEYQEACLGP